MSEQDEQASFLTAERPNEAHRNQISDLILLDADGNHLEIASELTASQDGSMSFEVVQPVVDGDRYRVTIKIEEI